MGWLSFFGGVSKGLGEGLTKARAFDQEQILRQQARMETEGLRLLRERREETKGLTARLDELATLGITGNSAAAVLRLSDTRYGEFIKRADEATRDAETLGARSKEVDAQAIKQASGLGFGVEGSMPPAPPGLEEQMGLLGITYEGGIREQQPTREEIINGIMGTFPESAASPKEEFDIQASLNKHLGMADVSSIARKQASQVVGISSADLDTLIKGTFAYSDAPEHIKIKMIQSESERLARKKSELAIIQGGLTIRDLEQKVAAGEKLNELYDKEIKIYDPTQENDELVIKAGTKTLHEIQTLVNIVKDQATARSLTTKPMTTGQYNIFDGIGSEQLNATVSRMGNSNDVQSNYNVRSGSYTTVFKGSLADSKAQAWKQKILSNNILIAKNIFSNTNGDIPSAANAARENFSFNMKMSGVQQIRAQFPGKSDEEISKLLRGPQGGLGALNDTFGNVQPIRDFVFSYFKSTSAERNVHDQKWSNILGLSSTTRLGQQQKVSSSIEVDGPMLGSQGGGAILEGATGETVDVSDTVLTFAQQFNTDFNFGDAKTVEDKAEALIGYLGTGPQKYNTAQINAFLGKLDKIKGNRQDIFDKDFIQNNLYLLDDNVEVESSNNTGAQDSGKKLENNVSPPYSRSSVAPVDPNRQVTMASIFEVTKKLGSALGTGFSEKEEAQLPSALESALQMVDTDFIEENNLLNVNEFTAKTILADKVLTPLLPDLEKAQVKLVSKTLMDLLFTKDNKGQRILVPSGP